jgi:cobaltochelatase CobS
LGFWEAGLVALKIKGDPSTGKTSIIEQFHAQLNWPLNQYSCNPSTQSFHLMGQLLPQLDGGLKWCDGVVLDAARNGTSVLLDEYNVMDPGEATGLNLLLEGYKVYIPETGEHVRPAKGFRVFATENSAMSKLSVTGRNIQDVANDERFMVTTADFLPEDLENQVVQKNLLACGTSANEAEMLAKRIVMVANNVRAAYRAGDSAIDKPMSTRVCIRWAKLFRRFRMVSTLEGGPMVYSLIRAFDMSPDMAEAVSEFTRAAVGTSAAKA